MIQQKKQKNLEVERTFINTLDLGKIINELDSGGSFGELALL